MADQNLHQAHGDTLSEFWDIEAHDPEGHGSNVTFRPAVVTAFLASAGVVVVGVTILAWIYYGMHSALLMLGIVGGLTVLVAFPVGSIVLMRSEAHTAMEQEAIELHAHADALEVRRDTVRLAVNARGADARDIEGGEYIATDGPRSVPADTDAIQRLEDEGGPVVVDESDEERPSRFASRLRSFGKA